MDALVFFASKACLFPTGAVTGDTVAEAAVFTGEKFLFIGFPDFRTDEEPFRTSNSTGIFLFACGCSLRLRASRDRRRDSPRSRARGEIGVLFEGVLCG